MEKQQESHFYSVKAENAEARLIDFQASLGDQLQVLEHAICPRITTTAAALFRKLVTA